MADKIDAKYKIVKLRIQIASISVFARFVIVKTGLYGSSELWKTFSSRAKSNELRSHGTLPRSTVALITLWVVPLKLRLFGRF